MQIPILDTVYYIDKTVLRQCCISFVTGIPLLCASNMALLFICCYPKQAFSTNSQGLLVQLNIYLKIRFIVK